MRVDVTPMDASRFPFLGKPDQFDTAVDGGARRVQVLAEDRSVSVCASA